MCARLRRVPGALKFPGRIKTPGASRFERARSPPPPPPPHASRFAVRCTRNAVSQCDKLSHPVPGLRPAVMIMQRCCFNATYNSRLCARLRRDPGAVGGDPLLRISLSASRVAVIGAALLRRASRLARSGYCAAVAARRPALIPLLSVIGFDLESRKILLPPGGFPGKRGPKTYP